MANQYSFGHKKPEQNMFGHPSNVKKLVNQEQGRDRSEYLPIHYLEWSYLSYAKCNDNYLCFNPSPHIIHRTSSCSLHVCPTFALLRTFAQSNANNYVVFYSANKVFETKVNYFATLAVTCIVISFAPAHWVFHKHIDVLFFLLKIRLSQLLKIINLALV